MISSLANRLLKRNQSIEWVPMEEPLSFDDKKYSNSTITDYVLRSSRSYLDIVRNRSPKSSQIHEWEYNFKLLFENIGREKSDLYVFDFGGGLVPLWWNLKPVITSFKLHWTVCEMEDLVAKSSEFIIEGLSFVSDPDEMPKGVDLLYSRCALQYVEDPIEMLKVLLEKEPRTVYLKKLGVSSDNSKQSYWQISNLQDQGPHQIKNSSERVCYPVHYYPIGDYQDLLEDYGYRVDWFLESDQGIPHAKLITLRGTMG